MDNETPAIEAPTASLPRAQPFAAAPRKQDLSTLVEAKGPDEGGVRTGVFSYLVKDDGDIAGLVAYSIYKQHKLDWLRAFEDARGRPPNDEELASFFIGEGTPRRIATYRHLAEATLSGRDVGSSGAGMERPRRRAVFAERGTLTPSLIAAYGLIAVLFVIGFWLALHYTMSSR